MFGQLVIGPPGSGKSTYCNGMNQFLSAIGRKASIVNLDPANDFLPYKCALDVRDFITLDQIMQQAGLGPNGGILYALEQLEENVGEFVAALKELGAKEYLLFDCPGQVELFTHHNSLLGVIDTIKAEIGARLCVVNLVDSQYLTSPSQYLSVVLMSLRTMLQFNLPHVNVFSKIDLLKNYGPLAFKLDYYTEVQELDYICDAVDEEIQGKYAGLTRAIASLVEDFGLVDFQVLAIENKRSMIHLLGVIDKALGYQFGTSEIGGDTVWVDAIRQGGIDIDIQDRWIDNKEHYDAAEDAEQADVAEQFEGATGGPREFSASGPGGAGGAFSTRVQRVNK